MRTFQARLHLTDEESILLDCYGTLFSKVEHTLFADLQKDELTLNKLKSSYLQRFAITARQFNSARSSVEGKIRSLKEIQKQKIADYKDQLARIHKRLTNKRPCNRHLLHQKRQKTEAKLIRLQKDQRAGKVRICFGTRKLFRGQRHLEKNGFESHREWLHEWRKKRSSAFFLMGSKDETAGNQSCAGKIENNGCLSFKLRLPNSFDQKYLIIENVAFKYGQGEILKALQENQARRSLQKENNSAYKERGLAITYRFSKDEKGWRLFLSMDHPAPTYVTNKNFGFIGVDLNIDHLALAETDRFGNPLKNVSLPLSLYGKTTNQAKALIGDVAKTLVDHAKKVKKPIVLEKLDFQNKKRRLNEGNPKQARMLSAFAYQKTLEAIKSRACREGIQVFEINPAYIESTSRFGV